MTSQAPRSLGILDLERGLPPGVERPILPGSLINPTTFDFPIILETVAGAWTDIVLPGNPSLEPACIAAARRLIDQGAVAITANCGFFIRHQPAVAAAVNVPVALSSLLLIPNLLRQLPPAAKLAVLTADSRHCGEDMLGVEDPVERARIVVDGIEGGKYLEDAMKRPLPPPDVDALQTDVMACVARVHGAHPDVAAILCECTAFPLVAPLMRRATKLPVYDITNLSRLMMASIA
nr:hypothetical protein [Bradyrhizobium icense]